MPLAFTVYGVPQAKGSMRAFQPRGLRAPVLTDSNRNVRGWQALVADAAGAAIRRLPVADRHVETGAVRCEIAYFLPRPKSLTTRKQSAREPAHTTRPDIDKLTRAVLDALTSVAWLDDAQVVELVAVKRYAGATAPARVDVSVQASTIGAATLFADADGGTR